MRRKVPDTWWGAIVVGVLAGAAGGVAGALTDGIWSSDSVAHRMAVFVPAAIAGVVVLSLLKHAQNMRRDRRHA
jgi:4-hydroxybenzoate polyprenyltransferase